MSQLKRYRSVVADSARWEGFRFRPGDIVISTPPKCGTTWMQRLVALLVFDDTQLYAPISRISPWLDMQLAPLEEVAALLDAQRHRRLIKTHTPLDGMRARAEHTAPNADISLWHDTQQFFHRGTSGQWHDVFSDDDLRAYDVRLAELAPPDLVAWLHSGWLGLPTSASPARTS
jgi:hypothetical protein